MADSPFRYVITGRITGIPKLMLIQVFVHRVRSEGSTGWWRVTSAGTATVVPVVSAPCCRGDSALIPGWAEL